MSSLNLEKIIKPEQSKSLFDFDQSISVEDSLSELIQTKSLEDKPNYSVFYLNSHSLDELKKLHKKIDDLSEQVSNEHVIIENKINPIFVSNEKYILKQMKLLRAYPVDSIKYIGLLLFIIGILFIPLNIISNIILLSPILISIFIFSGFFMFLMAIAEKYSQNKKKA